MITDLSTHFAAVQQAQTVAELADALLSLAREASRQRRLSGSKDNTIANTARELRSELYNYSRGTKSIKSEIKKLRVADYEFTMVMTSPGPGRPSQTGSSIYIQTDR